MSIDVQRAMRRMAQGRYGREWTASEAAAVRAALGSDVPEWYVSALMETAIAGSVFVYQSQGREVWIGWMLAQEVLEECGMIPGIFARREGYVPVGSCDEGSGDPYFVRFRDHEDPPLVQIFHDSLSEERGISDGAMRVIAPSLSDFFARAKVRE